ncbi:CRISPR-associated protein Cas4 [Thermococcus gorgonarius]|uniref:CRISPR-associated exonuclease Cas4 n=1 Tax=Thermococcus gorgonarius TaxID=71997 RepID=A0A2Z2M4L8_THEGO|nr:CRISPR-associated protein Cas4 [Thermococcus gorgonarius]ASJ00857.1 CRISPR-associated protein Cas4 [Thermococcus gorgonarius]
MSNNGSDGDGFIEFYASEALICPRRIYYRLKGYPERWPEFVKVRLNQGRNTHEILGDILQKRFGFELEKHLVLRSSRLGIEIHGRIDAFREFPIEIKGKTSLPKLPYEYHLAQLNVYLRWAEAEYGYLYYIKLHERPNTVIGKLDFSDFPVIKGPNFRLFEVPYDKSLFKATLKHFYSVKKAYERDRPPKGEYSYACKFCPYRYLCYPSEE